MTLVFWTAQAGACTCIAVCANTTLTVTKVKTYLAVDLIIKYRNRNPISKMT
jgi:hypothetical protein